MVAPAIGFWTVFISIMGKSVHQETQQINVAIFGGVPVDACYTNNPCVVMYIYDGQSCPSGWTHQSIGASNK